MVVQTVFFGANDACLPGSVTGQHVPLNEYKNNLKAILAHPSVVAQKPRLILLTPPPVNEYQLEEAEPIAQTEENPIRLAEHTKKYADACREVGGELGVVVLDVWSIFMAKAGWKEGQPLVGSKKIARNEVLEKLLNDGERILDTLQ